MSRRIANPLTLLLAAIAAAARLEFSWLNWPRSGDDRFSDYFVATPACTIRPDPDIAVVADGDASGFARPAGLKPRKQHYLAVARSLRDRGS